MRTLVRTLMLAAAAACSTPGPAWAADPPELAPSSNWTLDYAEDSCALRRMFGQDKNQAYLELRRFEPGMGLQVTFASNRMRIENPASFSFRFEPTESEWQSGLGAHVDVPA